MADKDYGTQPGDGSPQTINLAALELNGQRVSAFLLRRLAEAVDGFRGQEVFCRSRFTPDAQFDFEVSVEPAEPSGLTTLAAKQDPDFGVFGPFLTPEAKGPNLKDTRIKKITITLDDDRVVNVNPKKTDALFWTVSAVEKFLVPYYASVNSALAANTVLHTFDRAGMICTEHGPETEPHVVSADEAELPMDGGQSLKLLTDPQVLQGGEKPGLRFITFR